MRLFASTLLTTLALVAPGAAVAADMGYARGPAVISERPSTEEEIGTGWYLRGDIGFSKSTWQSVTTGGREFSDVTGKGSPVWGGGVGYKFNEWLRADVTVDHMSTLGLKSGLGSMGCFGTDTCTVSRRGDGRITPLLANAYFDMGNWYGFTPYVGAGAGVAWMKYDPGRMSFIGAANGATYATTDGFQKTTPALAAMAGLAVDLGSGITLDAGYRYLWLKDGSTGTRALLGGGAGIPGSVETRNYGFHQARVGLRYYVN
jgi:opacity protein-like surface antigen